MVQDEVERSTIGRGEETSKEAMVDAEVEDVPVAGTGVRTQPSTTYVRSPPLTVAE